MHDEKQRHSDEAEMKIYTPHRAAKESQAYGAAENAAADHDAPVRIYQRPFKPNQPTSPLG